MTTLTDLADELGVPAADLAVWMVTDPTGTDYDGGPDPLGRKITISDGVVSDLTLTADGEQTLRMQAKAVAAAPIELHRIEVARQLGVELHARAYPLAVLGGPEAVGRLDTDRWATQLSRQLAVAVADDDDRLLAETVIDLMAALWPTGDPPPEWWQSPVGRVCAHSAGISVETVTQSVAAAMLGEPLGSISSLVARGHLERGVGGGVSVASIMARIAR